jgi:hypothetical protein
MRRVALLALLTALLAPAAGNAASPPLEEIPGDHGHWLANAPQADGRRYVVSNPRPRLVRVLDVDTGATHDVPVGERCTMRAVAVNVALVACQGQSDAHLLDLDTREFTSIDVEERGLSFEWFDIGRHWIVAWWTSDVPATLYRNRRMGEERAFERFDGPAIDLDLRRPTTYSVGHYAWLRDGAFTLKDVPPRRVKRDLVLAREGGRRVRLSSCRRGCGRWQGRTGAALANGFAAWTEGQHKVRAYDSRTGERFAWHVEEPGYDQPHVGLTRRHIFVSVKETDEPGRVKLWRARVR